MKYYLQYRVLRPSYYSRLSVRYLLAMTTVLILFQSSTQIANALLSGDASLTYTAYDGSAKDSSAPSGRTNRSSSSMVQNYSLLYSSSGPVYNSRVGRYDVALGYNLTAIDTSFKSSTPINSNVNEDPYSVDYKKSRNHLLYKGEITLDPKEVPLRLNLYSRDMTRNTVTYSNGPGMERFSSIFGYNNQATDINDGVHIESGATLVAGVKNGMTNGYNELLRHFPMILLDYKDTVNKDLRSMTPVNDRLSRLAFVSLNKKDNWFHFRHTLYEDKINHLNDYIENEVQLGTVDQYMARRWIDFSNWIKVSTDLQFSKRQSNYQANAIEDVNLNLFATGERATWNARTFTTFNRYKDDDNKLSYQATIPVYAAGVASPDVSWNARTSFRNNRDIDTLGGSSKFTSSLLGYRVDAFKRSHFTLSQSFDVESSRTYTSDFLAISAGLESASTTRFARNVTLGAAYNIKNSVTSNDAASSANFLEQRLALRGGYTPTDTFRIEAAQTNTFTRGNFTAFDGTTRDSQMLLGQYANPRSWLTNSAGSDSYHSISTLTASWNPKPRLNTYLTLNEDIYKSTVLGVNPVTEVLSGVSYSNDVWSMSDTVTYTHGSRVVLDSSADSVSNSASLRYTHSRSLDGSVTASYSATSSRYGNVRNTNIDQRLNYSFFTTSGVARKLLEVNETLLYNDGTDNSSVAFTKALMLGFKYYPIRQLTLAGGVGYSYFTAISDYTIVWNASVGANFRLLQASLDFVHGIRKIDGASENKFTGNIRRSF